MLLNHIMYNKEPLVAKITTNICALITLYYYIFLLTYLLFCDRTAVVDVSTSYHVSHVNGKAASHEAHDSLPLTG